MPSEIKAFIAADSKSDPVLGTIERRDLRENDVGIDILFCGICHSDLHMSHNDWGATKYPFVGGHEIVGKVRDVGSAVSKFKPGDIVGVGCLVDSCQSCKPCEGGFENWCKTRVATYNGTDYHDHSTTRGGYSQAIVVRESFVLHIPKHLDLAGTAPLLCAGITTYSPLRTHKAGPGKKVAVVGLGGLGAMAVKIAKAMGAEVTVFSRTHAKDASAKELGATHVVASTDKAEVEAAEFTFDIIIDTVPFEHDIDMYMSTLTVGGTLVIVGLIGNAKFFTRSAMAGNKMIAASLIGGLRETQEMLDFCGEHNITCEHELIPYSYIGEAYKRVAKGDVKYRFVLDTKTIAA